MRTTFTTMAAACLLACAGAGAQAASFKDPLDTPATIGAEMAASSRMTAITAAGPNRLVAVGPRGHILVSNDAGKTWRQSPSPVSTDLVAVRFATPKMGWAVGHDGVVLRSSDGGASWTRQFDGRAALALMKTHYGARAAGGDARAIALMPDIERYVEEGPGKPFLDVLFLNEREGFVVGAFNMVFRTRDGGQSWEPLLERVANPRTLHLYSLARSGGHLYAAGEQGLLLRWEPETEQFVAMTSPYQGSFFGLLGGDKALLAFGLRGHLFQSLDGGGSWHKRETGVQDAITGAAWLPGGAFVVATQGGKLLAGGLEGALAEVPTARPMPYFSIAAAGAASVVTAGQAGVRAEPITLPSEASKYATR